MVPFNVNSLLFGMQYLVISLGYYCYSLTRLLHFIHTLEIVQRRAKQTFYKLKCRYIVYIVSIALLIFSLGWVKFQLI